MNQDHTKEIEDLKRQFELEKRGMYAVIGALVKRLGGDVELTYEEIEALKGMYMPIDRKEKSIRYYF